MPYTPATYSPRLHGHLDIEDYRLGRRNRLREAADIRRALRALPRGSAPYERTLTSLRARQMAMADLRSICEPARQVAIMQAAFAGLPSPSDLDLAAEAAALGRAA